MGPGFMNLRFMCHCLARAVKRHLEFSRGEHWFLQDLQQEEDDLDLEFSYQLPADLKLTLNPKGVRVGSDADEDDVSPFLRDDASPARDISTLDIDIGTARGEVKASVDSSRKQSSGIGEPEPELIASPSEREARLSNFVNNKPADTSATVEAEQIAEELDNEDAYSQDFEEHDGGDEEDQNIKEMRRDELSKLVY